MSRSNFDTQGPCLSYDLTYIYIACLTLYATIRGMAEEEYANIWNNRALGVKFFQIYHGVRYGQGVFEIQRKKDGRDLW